MSSTLEIQIYRHHRLRKDKMVGMCKDTVESLMKEDDPSTERPATLMIAR